MNCLGTRIIRITRCSTCLLYWSFICIGFQLVEIGGNRSFRIRSILHWYYLWMRKLTFQVRELRNRGMKWGRVQANIKKYQLAFAVPSLIFATIELIFGHASFN